MSTTHYNQGHTDIDSSTVNTTNTTNVFVGGVEDVPELKELREKLAIISKQVPAQTNYLKPVIEQLASFFDPAYIFMVKRVGNTSEDLNIYADLFIVIDNTDILFSDIVPILEIGLLKHQRVRCSLYSHGVVVDCLRNGHIFYSLNFTKDNIVYRSKELTLPIITSEAIFAMRERAKKMFMNGFNKAASFYHCAVNLQQNNPSPIMFFCLHQSIEFVYRAVLKSLNGYDKRTHNIRALKKYVARCAPQLNAILPEDTPEDTRFLNVLEDAYLDSRYNEKYSISKKDLALFFNKTKLILATSKEIAENVIDF